VDRLRSGSPKFVRHANSSLSLHRGKSSRRLEGFKVLDANGQAPVYVYARETRAEADMAKVLTFDERRGALP
jgi:hypothetical protein